jgi:fibronectin type 3 domain-containing protein
MTAVPGDTYYYWIKACNGSGCSEFSESDPGTRGIFPAPDVPTSLNASDGAYTDMVLITWDEPAPALSYRVYRHVFDDIGGATLLADNVISNEYGDTSAAAILYYYWVRACNSAGCSGYSTPDTGYIATSGPSVPTGVMASDGTYKEKVEVTWDAATGAKDYMVYRNTSDSTTGAILLADSHPSTTFDDTSASPSTDYYYWVRACGSGVCTGYSSSDLGYLYKTIPSKPSGVIASDGLYPDRVHLYWTDSDYTDYYRIFRNTINSTSGTIEMENAYPINSYDDLYAIPDITYYYFIKACNADGCSSFSNSESGYLGFPYSIFLPLILR